MNIVTHDELKEYADRLDEHFAALISEVRRLAVNGNGQLYFRREEAAEYLRVSVSLIDRWVAEGRLQRAKFGDGSSSVVGFRRKDLDALAESFMVKCNRNATVS